MSKRTFHDEGREDRVVVDHDGAAAAEALDQRDLRSFQRGDVDETLRLPAHHRHHHVAEAILIYGGDDTGDRSDQPALWRQE